MPGLGCPIPSASAWCSTLLAEPAHASRIALRSCTTGSGQATPEQGTGRSARQADLATVETPAGRLLMAGAAAVTAFVNPLRADAVAALGEVTSTFGAGASKPQAALLTWCIDMLWSCGC